MWCRKCRKGYLTYFNRGNSTMDCVKKCPPKHRQVKSEYFGQYCEKREERKKCLTIANCQYCPKKVSCKKCAKKYLKYKSTVLDDIHCVRTCPKGFRRKGKRCLPLKGRGCQDEFCIICKAGLYRVKRGLCRRRCPKGHYTVGTVRKFCMMTMMMMMMMMKMMMMMTVETVVVMVMCLMMTMAMAVMVQIVKMTMVVVVMVFDDD
ncbi:hypothetical protein QZH41_016449, partial [Actinostola sp. cb2023]